MINTAISVAACIGNELAPQISVNADIFGLPARRRGFTTQYHIRIGIFFPVVRFGGHDLITSCEMTPKA
jgi:hypothetical protein